MKYKALLLDVDGTLISNAVDALPSNAVTNAISQAKDKIHIGIATSRPIYLAGYILNHLDLSGPSILHGGAEIRDVKTGRIYFEEFIPKKTIQTIYSIAKANNLTLQLEQHEALAPVTDSYTFKDIQGAVITGVDPTIVNSIVMQINELHAVFPHKIPSWTKGNVDISLTPLHATKQQGIQKVAEILGITTHEIIGVGDGDNDFPLLMACGLKVAMGNAVPELKAIADYIAPSVEEDGVADIIEKFILNS